VAPRAASDRTPAELGLGLELELGLGLRLGARRQCAHARRADLLTAAEADGLQPRAAARVRG